MWLILFIMVLLVGWLSPSGAVVENYMNTSVNPCEDFYQYACGKWSDVNSHVEHGDTMSLLDVAMNEKIAELLERNKEQGVMAKMKTFYRSCRNLENYNLNQFLAVVKPKSGWAVYESSWKAQDFVWLDTVAELRKYSVHIFLDQTVMPKWDNTSVNSIYLDMVKVHPSSKASMLEILKKASIDEAKAESIALELMKFEKNLGDFTPTSSHSPDNDDTEEVVLGYLSESLPQVNWAKYLAILFGRELDLYTPMIIQNTEVTSKLVAFLDKSEPRLVCNYIMFKFLQFLDEHSIAVTSPNECITALHQGMPLAVGHLIENHFYDPEYDQVVQDLLNFLKVEFLSEVSKLYENQRDILLFLYTKTSVMELQIGNVKRNLTSEAVSKYYQRLEILDDRFYANLLTSFKYKTDKDLESLNATTSPNIAYQWTVTPSPFFVQPKNRIVVPLTLLQDSILGKNSAERFSVLGFIIGHEFLHAFDLTGVNYDYEGSVVESAISRSLEFAERVQCVKKQLQAKGVEEKIADLGGIRLSFNAYRRSLMQIGQNITNKEGATRTLGHTKNEGATRTLGQLFFIDFAQFFCGISQKEVHLYLGPDTHEADELRVTQSLSHFEEFSNAFGCPAGSAMNPEKKCRVW